MMNIVAGALTILCIIILLTGIGIAQFGRNVSREEKWVVTVAGVIGLVMCLVAGAGLIVIAINDNTDVQTRSQSIKQNIDDAKVLLDKIESQLNSQ